VVSAAAPKYGRGPGKRLAFNFFLNLKHPPQLVTTGFNHFEAVDDPDRDKSASPLLGDRPSIENVWTKHAADSPPAFEAHLIPSELYRLKHWYRSPKVLLLTIPIFDQLVGICVRPKLMLSFPCRVSIRKDKRIADEVAKGMEGRWGWWTWRKRGVGSDRKV